MVVSVAQHCPSCGTFLDAQGRCRSPECRPTAHGAQAGTEATTRAQRLEATAGSPVRRPEGVTAPPAEKGKPCQQCGTLTKRRDGICRRCRRSTANDPKSWSGRRSPATVDESCGPVPVEEVGCCDFAYVPVYRQGVATDETRRCKNAVRLPEQFCHLHGGNPANSFAGKTLAKATAESSRGELFPVAEEHWANAEARYEALEGQIAAMLRTDPSRLAHLHEAARQSGVGRFSPSNQQMVALAHYVDGIARGMSDDAAFDRAMKLLREPHLKARDWALKGRAPTGPGVPVLYVRPGEYVTRRSGESDEDWERRRRRARTIRAVHLEYPLSATAGEPYEAPPDPYDVVRPTGFGDPDKAYETLKRYANDRGYRVREVAERPDNGAYAYWHAGRSEIVVWTGIAGGDRRAQCHSLAHEIGHADAGHGTSSSAAWRRSDKEAVAESVAFLTLARLGIESAEISSDYVHHHDHRRPEPWAPAASAANFRQAARIADGIFANIDAASAGSRAS